MHVTGAPQLSALGSSRSLGGAIASLTGVSYGSAHTVPCLLLPDRIDGRGLFERRDRALRGQVVFDGRPHHVIELTEQGDLLRVFLDEATLVVRRIEEPSRRVTTDYAAILSPPG